MKGEADNFGCSAGNAILSKGVRGESDHMHVPAHPELARLQLAELLDFRPDLGVIPPRAARCHPQCRRHGTAAQGAD